MEITTITLNSDSNSNQNVSESELPPLSNSDSDLSSSLSSLAEMAFDPKEAFTLCRNANAFDEINLILANKFGGKAPLCVLIADMVNLRQRDNEDAKILWRWSLTATKKIRGGF